MEESVGKLKVLIFLTFLLVVLVPPGVLHAAEADYYISHYEATFKLVPDTAGELRDVEVTLFITYSITNGPKSDGFKFIGELPVKDISVTDAEGEPLKHEFREMDENRIKWHFTPLDHGQQTVIVHFTLVNALEGSLKENNLRFDWVKNWKVPMHDATYRFILPEDYGIENIEAGPAEGVLVDYQGVRAIEVRQDLLSNRPFTVSFSPGVAQGKSTLDAVSNEGVSILSTGRLQVWCCYGFIAIGFILFWIIRARYFPSLRINFFGIPIGGSGGCSGCDGCGGCGGCSGCGGCGG